MSVPAANLHLVFKKFIIIDDDYDDDDDTVADYDDEDYDHNIIEGIIGLQESPFDQDNVL